MERLEGEPPAGPSRRVSLLVLAGVGLVVASLVVSALIQSRSGPSASDPTGPASTGSGPSAGSRSEPSAPPTPIPGAAPVVVTPNAGPQLPKASGWTLFARSRDSLFRLDLGTGRVLRTDGVTVASTGPLDLAVGRDDVWIRPLDSVAGYRVRDGHAPAPLTGLLDEAHWAYPGPRGLVWAVSGAPSGTTAVLVHPDGRPTERRFTATGTFLPDGNGGLLVSDVGGVWAARSVGLRRIARGTVYAIGPTTLLTADCDDHHICRSHAVDRESGRRRDLGVISTDALPTGTVSPDGRWAALVKTQADGATRTLELLDVRSGVLVYSEPWSGTDAQGPALAWSPDSRWLALISDSELAFVSPRSRERRSVALALPPLLNLGFRVTT